MSTVTLQSRSKFPIRVKYGSETLNIPPQGRAEGIDEALLGEIPTGITVVMPAQTVKKSISKNQKRN